MDFADPVRIRRGFGFQHQRVAFRVCGEDNVQNGVIRRGDLLRDPAEPGAGVQADGAVGARVLDVFADQTQQGGFAGAIAADQADLPASRDLRRGGLEQRPGFDLEVEIGNRKHARRSTRDHRERKGVGALPDDDIDQRDVGLGFTLHRRGTVIIAVVPDIYFLWPGIGHFAGHAFTPRRNVRPGGCGTIDFPHVADVLAPVSASIVNTLVDAVFA